MTDTRGSALSCNDLCGCPVPCSSGAACRCVGSGVTTSGEGDGHNRCSCGEHCGCNPCTCPKSVVSSGVGKAYCKCGDGCTCVPCRS